MRTKIDLETFTLPLHPDFPYFRIFPELRCLDCQGISSIVQEGDEWFLEEYHSIRCPHYKECR